MSIRSYLYKSFEFKSKHDCHQNTILKTGVQWTSITLHAKEANFLHFSPLLEIAILDIPVHASKIASLHLLFNLFYEFKNSQVLSQAVPVGSIVLFLG